MRTLASAPVFTSDDALAAGWTPSALKNAVRHGHLVRLLRGVYTAGAATPQLAAVAAARALSAAVVSHRSAVLLHGLPLLGTLPPVPEVTVPQLGGANHPHARIHRAQLRPEDITLVGDTEVTAVARTTVDLARHRPVGTAVAAMDAALQRNMTTLDEIEDVLRFCWNWPRIRRAQVAVRLSDGHAESPLESISRLVLRELHIRPPATQVPIFDRYGRLVGRSDFYWDEFGVIGEADGRSKYDERHVLVAEKEHQEHYEELGLVVVRWGWDYATSRRHVLKVRLENAFERGKARDRSGFPRLWTL
jgi:hypothetical protein